MPKSCRQKMKILYLMKAFSELTDEEHPMTTKDLMAYLEEMGIQVERKTIYDDIEMLRIFGMDIVNRRERPSGYYLASRTFELAELKLLVDAVQSSRFITAKKSRQLIRKLEGLTGRHEAKLLQQQVNVESRIKTANESIYYNIDEIHKAISQNRQISFQYCEWTISKELRLKRDGELYKASPWGMIWKDDNYYLIALDKKSGLVKHYRVDKMLKIRIDREARDGREIFQEFDAASFSSKTFGMFGGNEETVTLEFENHFIGVAIDRFGRDTMIMKKDEEHFTAVVHVVVSSQFFGWLAGLGSGVRIAGPSGVKTEYRRFLLKALEGTE